MPGFKALKDSLTLLLGAQLAGDWLKPVLIYHSENPAAAATKLLQLCLTLCDPRDSSPPGSPIPGILQARTLEWVAISFSNACKWKVKVKSLSCVWLFTTPWTAAYQVPPSMGFSRQEYWSRVPLPSLGGHHKKFLIAFCQTKNLTLENLFKNDVRLDTSHTFYHTVIVWNQNAYEPTLTTFFFISLYHTA